jgi:hypothetical protein
MDRDIINPVIGGFNFQVGGSEPQVLVRVPLFIDSSVTAS